MSVHVSSWAWKQDVGDDGAKLVLLKLADSANDDGVAWPSPETLQAECEIGHADTVRRRLRKLRDLELIVSVPWNGVDGRQTTSTFLVLHRGMPSAERLWEILEQTNRKGGPTVAFDELAAAEAIGSFLRGGGATVHTLDTGRGSAAMHPEGVTGMHPPIEEPEVEPSTEGANAPPVPASAGDRARLKNQIRWALTEAIGVPPVTRSEHGRWGSAIAELADAGVTPDEVRERCAWWREHWSHLVLQPKGLVANWSLLGAQLANAKPGGFDVWLEHAPSRFTREDAHLVVDDARIDDVERARRHQLIDELYDRTSDERSNAA